MYKMYKFPFLDGDVPRSLCNKTIFLKCLLFLPLCMRILCLVMLSLVSIQGLPSHHSVVVYIIMAFPGHTHLFLCNHLADQERELVV